MRFSLGFAVNGIAIYKFDKLSYDTSFKMQYAFDTWEGEMADSMMNTISEETKGHFKRIFKTVEEHKDEKFPYFTNYSSEEEKDHYFVVSHPPHRLTNIPRYTQLNK